MKRFLLVVELFLLFFSYSLFAGMQEKFMEFKNDRVYHNGDQLSLTLPNFSPTGTINRAFQITYYQNSTHSQNTRISEIKNYKLSGDVFVYMLDDLEVNDVFVEIIILSGRSVYWMKNLAAVQGNLPATNQILDEGSFSIYDVSGGTFSEKDEAGVEGSGFLPGETIDMVLFREYDGEGNFLEVQTEVREPDLVIHEDGSIEGIVPRDGSPFDPQTRSIGVLILPGESPPVNSLNRLPTNASNPPVFTAAKVISSDQVKVYFDDDVSVPSSNLAARDNWQIGNGSEYTVTTVAPLGVNTNVCTLNVSGSFNKSQRPRLSFYRNPDEYQNLAGNPAETVENLLSSDSLAPGNVVLFLGDDQSRLTTADFIGSGSVSLIAHVADGVVSSDSALDGVLFQGSDDGLSWLDIGLDGTLEENYSLTSGDSAKFSVIWNAGVQQFRMVRAVAFDGGPTGSAGMNDQLDPDDNTTASILGATSDGFNQNFKDTYRAVIASITPTSIPVSGSAGENRAQVRVEIQDNYGNARNTLSANMLFRLTEKTTTTESWWNQAYPGGSASSNQILLIINSGVSAGNVWYSNQGSVADAVLALAEPGGNFVAHQGVVSANGSTVTVTGGSANKILIAIDNQTFTSGSGIIGDPNDQVAGNAFNIKLYIVDGSNNIVFTMDNQLDIDFTSNATAAPDGTLPLIKNLTPANWNNVSISFTDGVSEDIPVQLFDAATAVQFTAADDGALSLGGEPSSPVTVNPGPLQDFQFVVGSSQLDAYPVAGTNTLTAQDDFENAISSFDAAANNVTISGALSGGGGVVNIQGLGGAGGDVLNQTGDFTNGVSDLTSRLRIDVDASPNTYVLTATSTDGKSGISNDVVVNNRTLVISDPTTPADANIDASAKNSDLPVAAAINGDEETDYGYSDDFRIRWGFGNNADGSNLQVTGTSPDLALGGGNLSQNISASDIRTGAAYSYFFWWIENVSQAGNKTVLSGLPVTSAMRRAFANPTLLTSGGEAASGGSFTPGVPNQEIVSLQFDCDPVEATIQLISLNLEKFGTADGSDVTAFHLYQDNGSIGLLDGADVLLSDFAYTSGTAVTFNSFVLGAGGGASSHALITVDVDEHAVTTHTLGLRLVNEYQIDLADNVLNGSATSLKKASFENIGTSGDHTLPVSLLSFEARYSENQVVLSWETASEINNEGFFLYRSDNETNQFVKLNYDIVPGQGSSNNSHSYEFCDENVEDGNSYYYKLISRDFNGALHGYGTISIDISEVPSVYKLYPNYPNPFNPSTRIMFDIPKESRISVEIFNILGQKIRTLVNNAVFAPGSYDYLVWNAKDDLGRTVPNGVYYLVFTAGEDNFQHVSKMVYMK